MAILSHITCEQCGEKKDVMHSPSEVTPKFCDECKAKTKAEAKDRYLMSLGGLSIEERLRKLEEWIYDYRPTYVEPPRF